MTGSLSKDDVARYHRDGFLKPITVFSAEKIKEIHKGIDAIERDYSTKDLPHDLTHYFRVNGELVIPLLTEVALSKSILDAMESILGPNLMVWSCELFIKEPQSHKIVSWHQDLTYWGMGGTDLQATAWIAISDVTETSGCMRFVPESHKQQLVPHIDTFSEDNLLSRGQEIAVDIDERDAVLNILKPGEMSIHNGKMFHASGPNLSKDRRIAIVIRYITPELERDAPESDFAMLVRGTDSCKNWINVAPPSTLFGQGEMKLYDEILKCKETILGYKRI